jgi:hypothetical protein
VGAIDVEIVFEEVPLGIPETVREDVVFVCLRRKLLTHG